MTGLPPLCPRLVRRAIRLPRIDWPVGPRPFAFLGEVMVVGDNREGGFSNHIVHGQAQGDVHGNSDDVFRQEDFKVENNERWRRPRGRPGSGTPGLWYPIVNRDAIPALPAAGWASLQHLRCNTHPSLAIVLRAIAMAMTADESHANQSPAIRLTDPAPMTPDMQRRRDRGVRCSRFGITVIVKLTSLPADASAPKPLRLVKESRRES